MYLVTSFDFGGNSTVNVHVVTDDLALAETVYASVCNAEKARDNGKMLVELTRVPPNAPMLGSDALTLFWGENKAVRVKCNN